ncbi:MAG: hypothetical protein GY820_17985 [Gammaproteobacteria bacterium]|nr:hypothetical protein [Gammaproteobacteria bacterium]
MFATTTFCSQISLVIFDRYSAAITLTDDTRSQIVLTLYLRRSSPPKMSFSRSSSLVLILADVLTGSCTPPFLADDEKDKAAPRKHRRRRWHTPSTADALPKQTNDVPSQAIITTQHFNSAAPFPLQQMTAASTFLPQLLKICGAKAASPPLTLFVSQRRKPN